MKAIDTTKEAYLQFVSKNESLFKNTFAPYFKEYETAFRNQTNTKKTLGKISETERKEKAKQPLKRNEKSSEEQKQLLSNDFFDWVKEIEENKLLIFALTYQQQTLIITAPTDTNEQKRFLGYTSSERRGNEGLKETDGLLTNILDRNDKQKLAWSVRCAFDGKNCVNDELEKYAKCVRTSDMMDFSKPYFNIQIKLSTYKEIEIESKYPLAKLGDKVEIIRGVTFDKQFQTTEETDNVVLTADNITLDGRFEVVKKLYVLDTVRFDSSKRLKKNDCFMCFASGSKQHVGKVAYIPSDQPYYAGGFMGILRTKDEDLFPKFLYESLNNETIREIVRSKSNGSNIQNLSKSVGEVKMPLPPIDIQKQIVSECEAVDDEYNRNCASVEENKEKIVKVFEKLSNKSGLKFKELQSLLVKITGNKTKIAENQIVSQGKYPVITQESDRLVAGYTDEENVIDDLPLIVFGDHSCTFKYVDFPFVRGADGTQLLKADSEIVIPKFLYEYLLTIQLENAGRYERHYKYLKRVKVPIPSIIDQQQVVSEIETYEQKIAEAKTVLAGCAERKKQILEKWLR